MMETPEFNTLNYKFRYENLSRDIDKIEDINELRLISKQFLSLYLLQLELLTSWPNQQTDKNS
jgi:hypothetical protein